jgi:hypothetical protein
MTETLRQHMIRRGCNPSNYTCVVDEETRTATFVLFAPGTGKVTGYHTYKPEGPKTREGKGFNPKDLRYFTKHLGSTDEILFFGAEKLDFGKKNLYLVEGIFDAVKFHTLGHNCLAVLCNNPVPLKSFLNASPFHVVGVLDADAAGKKLAKYCDEYILCEDGKDPGDLELLEITELLHFGKRHVNRR